MAKIFTYSPKEVGITIGGYTVTGWKSISIRRSVSGFMPIRGIRGKNTRVRNRDTSCTITLPIMQTSMSNDVMQRIHELDMAHGTARIELTVKDASGTSVFSSFEAYILGYPEVVYSEGMEFREWVIFCQSTSSYVVGGNAQVKSIFSGLMDAASGAVDAVTGAFS